jgi:hypothetical protein
MISHAHPRPQCIRAQEVKIDHSMARSNPLDHVSFFDDLSSTSARKLKPEQISSMVPPCFQVGAASPPVALRAVVRCERGESCSWEFSCVTEMRPWARTESGHSTLHALLFSLPCQGASTAANVSQPRTVALD